MVWEPDSIDLAHDGLMTEIIAASYPIYQGSPIVDLVHKNKIKAWNVPMGALYALLREIGAGRPGLLTKVGLDTFVDPASEGGNAQQGNRSELCPARQV